MPQSSLDSTDTTYSASGTLPMWLAAIAVGATGAGLLFDADPGLNWLFCTTLTAALYVALARTYAMRRVQPFTLGTMALAILLAGAAVVTANGALHFFIWVGVVTLFATATVVNGGVPVNRLGPAALAGAPFRASVLIARETADRSGNAARGVLRIDSHFRMLRGIALALPIVVVFFLLLGSADPTLSAWRDDLARMLQDMESLGRLGFFVMLTGATLGVYGIAIRARPESGTELPSQCPRRSFADEERLIVLGSVALLFAVFLVLQLSYLFGNPGGRAGSGMTLAEAVHRGFGELTIVVTLCAWIIIASDRYSIRGAREQHVRMLGLILVTECLLLLASAWHRLAAYAAAYGYTSLRLYVAFYIAATALGLLFLAREIVASIDLARLTRRTALIAIGVLAFLGYWNSAAWIVRQNVARFEATGQVDLQYLAWQMSDDALPEIVRSIPQLPPNEAKSLAEQLHKHYDTQLGPASPAPAWYEWNLRRDAARRALREIP